MNYLDKTGLTYYHSKIKDKLKSYYGTCETAAGTQAKVVTCSGFKLETGARITVKFTNAQTYNGTATLNVNSTGDINICRVGTTTTTRYYWTAGEVVDFVYDGTNYVMQGKGTATTTYYGLTKLSNSTSSTSTSLAATANAVKTAYDLANTANTQATTNATAITNKQDTLVSGTNIKTINGESLLGEGDITISGGGGAEEFILYENSSGSNAMITLTDNVAYYKTIEIYYGTSAATKTLNYMKVDIRFFTKLPSLVYDYIDGGKISKKSVTTLNISGSYLTPAYYYKREISSSGVTSFDTTTNDIYIRKVIGYK